MLSRRIGWPNPGLTEPSSTPSRTLHYGVSHLVLDVGLLGARSSAGLHVEEFLTYGKPNSMQASAAFKTVLMMKLRYKTCVAPQPRASNPQAVDPEFVRLPKAPDQRAQSWGHGVLKEGGGVGSFSDRCELP